MCCRKLRREVYDNDVTPADVAVCCLLLSHFYFFCFSKFLSLVVASLFRNKTQDSVIQTYSYCCFASEVIVRLRVDFSAPFRSDSREATEV